MGLLGLALTQDSQEEGLPPRASDNSKKLKLKAEVKDGKLVAKLKVGFQRTEMKVAVTTQTPFVMLPRDTCACGQKASFVMEDSSSAAQMNRAIQTNSVYEDVFKQSWLQTFEGYQVKDRVEHGRQGNINPTSTTWGTPMDMIFYLNHNATQPYQADNPNDGYYGLGTYDEIFRTWSRYHTLTQLQLEGKIEHLVFSIPQQLDGVLIGDWTPTLAYGSNNDKKLEMVRTIDSSTWRIMCDSFIVGAQDIQFIEMRKILFDPSFDYLYLPYIAFDQLANVVNEIFEYTVCDLDSRKCQIDSKCDEIDHWDLTMRWNVTDYTRDAPIEIMLPSKQMYVDTLVDGQDKCVIPIYSQENPDNDDHTWILGQIFFKNHYSIFDMSNADLNTEKMGSERYLQVGISSLINPEPTEDPIRPAKPHNPQPHIDGGEGSEEFDFMTFINDNMLYVIISAGILGFILVVGICCCVCQASSRRRKNTRSATELLSRLEKTVGQRTQSEMDRDNEEGQAVPLNQTVEVVDSEDSELEDNKNHS